MRDTFVAAVADGLDRDEQLALVLADIGVSRFEEYGVFERHPRRAINVGIREALAVGAAAGYALEGFVPVVHSYAPFLVERAFEQIKLDFVHQALPGVLVSIGASYDASTEGRTHQAPGDVALLGTLPDVRIELPGHPAEVEGALARARHHGHASYVRLSSAENTEAFAPGVTVVRDGRRGTALVIGPLLDAVLTAATDLDLRVVYTPTARPLPSRLAEAIVPGAPVALVEPVLEGTSVAAVLAVFARPGPIVPFVPFVPFVPIVPIGVGRRELRRYGTPADHAAAHELDAAGLRRRLLRMLSDDLPG